MPSSAPAMAPDSAPLPRATRGLILRDISIQNFRSLYRVKNVEILPGMTVLTGQNDGGKTALIDALKLLLDESKADAGDRSQWAKDGDDRIIVQGTFCSDGDEGDIYRIRRIVDSNERHAHEQAKRVHKIFGSDPEAMSLQDLKAKLKLLGLQPAGTAKQPMLEMAWEWIRLQPDSDFIDAWVPLAADVKTRLPLLSVFSSTGAPNVCAEVQGLIVRQTRILLGDVHYRDRLDTIASELRAGLQPAIDSLQEHIRAYCDGDEVQVRTEIDFTKPSCAVDLDLVRQSNTVQFGKTGQGRQRRMSLAVHASLLSTSAARRGRTEIFAYDEPDTHFDYMTQRELFSLLERQVAEQKIQILVATHSMNFIDRVPLTAIRHFRLDGQFQTVVDRLVSEDANSELDFLCSVGTSLGLRNSILLDERCFLLVEGETEEAAIPLLFKIATGRSLASAGICLVNTKGCGPMRQFIETLVSTWKRKAVLLADMDTRLELEGWTEKLNMTIGKNAFFVGNPKEFEDTFMDSVWLRALRASFPPKAGNPEWQEEDISSLRADSKFSQSLNLMVKRRCADHSISKPHLGVALARVLNDAKDLPQVLKECFAASLEAAR